MNNGAWYANTNETYQTKATVLIPQLGISNQFPYPRVQIAYLKDKLTFKQKKFRVWISFILPFFYLYFLVIGAFDEDNTFLEIFLFLVYLHQY